MRDDLLARQIKQDLSQVHREDQQLKSQGNNEIFILFHVID